MTNLRDMLLNSTSVCRSRLLEGLLREKNAGRLPGLFGRLGDLGTIDDKYDVAVSTACGALNNIVCDNMETAQVRFIVVFMLLALGPHYRYK